MTGFETAMRVLLALSCLLLQLTSAQKCRTFELTKEPPYPPLSIIITRDYYGDVLVEAQFSLIPPSNTPTNFTFDFTPPNNTSEVASVRVIHADGTQMLGMWCEGMDEDSVLFKEPFTTTLKEDVPRTIRLQVGPKSVQVLEVSGGEDKVSGQITCANLTSFPHLELQSKCEAQGEDKCGSVSQNCVKETSEGAATSAKMEDNMGGGMGAISSVTAVVALLLLLAAV